MRSIFDPHIHLWSPRTTPRLVTPAVKLLGWSDWAMRNVAPRLFPVAARNFVGKTDYVMGDYLPPDWAADAGELADAELLGFVHIEAGWHGKGALGPAGETRWLEQIGGPQLRGIVGKASLEADPAELGALLDAHAAASPRFVGVRDMLSHDPDRRVMNYSERGARCRDPAWQRGFAELGRRGLSFDAWMYHPQLKAFETVLAAHPETRVVLDHLGTPLGYGGPVGHYGSDPAARAQIAARWREDLAAVAAHPQVHVKISGLTMPVLGWALHEREAPPGQAELVDRLGPLVETALELFGPRRCMFASNFPMDKVSASWAGLFGAFDELTRTRDAAERAGLFHGNALRFYGLEHGIQGSEVDGG